MHKKIFLLICCGIFTLMCTAQPSPEEQQMLAQVKMLQQPNQEPDVTYIIPNKFSGTGAVETGKNTHGGFDHRCPGIDVPCKEALLDETPMQESINHQAFKETVRSLIPMSPDQVHRLRQIYNASQFAAAAPAAIPPKPTATSIYVNLSPGATPPVIRLNEGFVTSLVFLDSTGAPWPIEAYDIGNPKVFSIEWDKKTNVMMVQARSLYTYGNLAVRLRGLTTPVMLTLIPGQVIVDYRVDITVPGFGPEARHLPITTGLPLPATDMLLRVLDGVAPNGSRILKVSNNAGQVWITKYDMYLRTPYTLLSPGWLATMSSADGTHAYQLQKTPMLLMSINGEVVHVKVEGF